MHSINGFLERMFGGRPTGNGHATTPVEGDGWERRPEMSAGTARKILRDRDMRLAGKSDLPKQYQSKDYGPDPRDTPKYGVTGTSRYSTKSKHGTGRGGSVGPW